MPHLRKRYLNPLLKDAMSFSPLVGVLGQRQVGKTTLVEAIAPKSYITLDEEDNLSIATHSPKAFLSTLPSPTVIDECQKAPPLFSALKLHVQRNKRPGQFLLTGSVRFTSRSEIKESLTGRIYLLELLPFSVAEIHQEPLQDFTQWHSLTTAELERRFNRRIEKFGQDMVTEFLGRGGLPGILFLRKASHRNNKMKGHLQTLLQRDIHLIVKTTVPFENLLLLLKYLAHQQGRPLSYTDASRFASISINSLKRIIFAYENMFLIRRVMGEDYRKGETFYFEDQGTATYLSPSPLIANEARFAYSQLLAQAHYHHPSEYLLTYYESKGGANVPFVFTVKNGKYGFVLNYAEGVGLSAVRTAESFCKKFSNSKVFILSPSRRPQRISKQILQIPLLGIA